MQWRASFSTAEHLALGWFIPMQASLLPLFFTLASFLSEMKLTVKLGVGHELDVDQNQGKCLPGSLGNETAAFGGVGCLDPSSNDLTANRLLMHIKAPL